MHLRHDHLYLAITIVVGVAYVAHTLHDLYEEVKAGTKSRSAAAAAFVVDARTLAVVGLMLLWFVGESVRDLEKAVSADTATHVHAAIVADPILSDIFAPWVGRVEENVQKLPKHRFSFTYGNLFTNAYIRVLKAFPKAHLLAVTSPVKTHVWAALENAPIYPAMFAFAKEGGDISRIFVVDDPSNIVTAQLGVIQCHQEALVKTYIVRRDQQDSDDLKFVLVESNNRFGWSANVVMGDVIKDVDASTDVSDVQRWRDVYDHLKPSAEFTKTDLERALRGRDLNDREYVAITSACREAIRSRNSDLP
jgi:hypothetical protein